VKSLVDPPVQEIAVPMGTADACGRFTADCAQRGCRIMYGGKPDGTTCIDLQESAQRALDTGEQPVGAAWGIEPNTDTRRWTERVASGEQLCRGCRAKRALEGVYYPPAERKHEAA
jgi:hypothetical protein